MNYVPGGSWGKVSQSVLQLWGAACSLVQERYEDSTRWSPNTAESRGRKVTTDEIFPPHFTWQDL